MMQVTIYLPNQLIEKIDSLAEKIGKSRSACIQEFLQQGLQRATRGTRPLTTLSAFGGWKDISNRKIKEIRRSLGKDAKRAALR